MALARIAVRVRGRTRRIGVPRGGAPAGGQPPWTTGGGGPRARRAAPHPFLCLLTEMIGLSDWLVGQAFLLFLVPRWAWPPTTSVTGIGEGRGRPRRGG